MNELMNYKGICRTAQATLGLLKTCKSLNISNWDYRAHPVQGTGTKTITFIKKISVHDKHLYTRMPPITSKDKDRIKGLSSEPG